MKYRAIWLMLLAGPSGSVSTELAAGRSAAVDWVVNSGYRECWYPSVVWADGVIA